MQVELAFTSGDKSLGPLFSTRPSIYILRNMV